MIRRGSQKKAFLLNTYKPTRITCSLHFLLALIVLGGSAHTLAQNPYRIGVIYPETSQPYSEVFNAIIAGIEAELGKAKVTSKSLQSNSTEKNLRQWIVQAEPAAVIVLGRLPYEQFAALDTPLPYVIGALDASPATHPHVNGISLSVAPELMLERLTLLSPGTHRVLVVFDPVRDGWLIELAKEAARNSGLVVEHYEATNLREASQHFLNIFTYANPQTDALWLTLNDLLVNDNNFPTIVHRSWQRSLPVFSNNLEHANRGVLFSVFPDAEGLGRRLGRLAIRGVKNPQQRTEILPLSDVRYALNVRVANHLGLSVPEHIRTKFDFFFGTR